MQDVPKIVRERLKVATPALNHPDADMLTAFSERSLPEVERDIVIEHLARCGECREIVALALPETEALETVVRPAASGWFAWPVLRWGFVSAGIVLVAWLGVVLYQRQTHSATVAYRATVPAVTSTAPQDSAAQATAQTQPSVQRDEVPATTRLDSRTEKKTEAKEIEDQKVADKKLAAVTKPLAQADETAAAARPQIGGVIGGNAIHGQLTHGPRLANQTAQQNAYVNQAQNAAPAAPPSAKQSLGGAAAAVAKAPAPVSQSVEVSSQAAAINTTSQAQDEIALRSEAIPLQPSPGGSGGVVVNRAKEPGTLVVGSVEIPGGAMPQSTPTSAIGGPTRVPSARWTINANGSLQRSLDQGNTWQDVNVNAPSAAASGMSYAVAKSAPMKEKDSSKILKRELIAPTFRAVAANGEDVWAGGSAGMLYHSTDSGATWTRVIPASSGATLTGDVVALEFSDSIHGKVATSTPEVWITTDAGLTWQKQ